MSKHKEEFLDEIDLCQYLRIINKRKKLIIGIFLLSAISAIIINLLTPKEFEANATIVLDIITNASKEESMQSIKLIQIPTSYFKNREQTLNNTSVRILTEDIPSTNLIRLKTFHTDAKTTIDTCNFIAKSFILERNKDYDKGIKLLNKRIQDLNSRNKGISEEIEYLRKEIKQNPENRDKSETTSALTVLINYENIYSALDNEMFSLITKLSNSTESKLIASMLLQNNSFKTNSIKKFITFVLSGLLLSICLIFFLESCKINNSQ